MPGFLDEVARAAEASGAPLGALGLAWARAAPLVVLVPAFGMRALPAAARTVLGLVLAVAIVPAFVPSARAGGPWALLLLENVVRGLPIAIAAAVPLWAATMAGGVVDALRGASDMVSLPTGEGRSTPLGVPLSLLAAAIFLSTGGPARAARALVGADVPAHPLLAIARDVTSGIALAVALAGPLLVASVVLEIGAALVARAASPAQVHALLAPARALGILIVLALVLDRLAGVLAAAMP